MLRSRWLWLAIVVVAALGVWWFRSRSASDAPKFRTAALERGDLRATVSATGTVKPVTQVEVGSQVSGIAVKLGADFNSRVRAGQVLCQLDPSSFEARVAQSDAAVLRADAALKEAERQYRRSQELVRDNYVSQADVETAESAVAQRRADLQQARAQLQVARVDLQNTTIRSPIDGVVISRAIDVGQTVAASLQAPKLFVIANDLASMQVETNIDEADIGRVRTGQPVEFTVDAFPDATFEGEVSQVRLEPINQQNVVTYTTVIHTRNDDLRLRPGMTANVSVITDRREGVLKVANAALRFRPPGATGGGNDRGGAGGGANAGGRRGFAAVLPSLSFVSPAWAQGAPAERPAGARPAGERRGGRPAEGAARDRGAAPADAPGRDAMTPKGANGHGERAPEGMKPGTVYVLEAGKPKAVRVMTGITDGTMTELRSQDLKEGDLVVVGTEAAANAQNRNLQPPPGMGGPQFRGPGGRR